MAQPNFDYQGAKEAGYSDDEINNFLEQQQSKVKPAQKNGFISNITNNMSNLVENFGNPKGIKQEEQEPSQQELIDQRLLKHTPNFDVNAALEAGYSADDINDFLQERVPEKNLLQKTGRLGTQVALGRAEMAALSYELAVAPLASKEAQTQAYRQNVGDDIERLLEQKATGQWDEQDQRLLQHLEEQMQDFEKSAQFSQTANLGIRGLAEKATGLDLHPEGILEKGANWLGFIKKPSNLKEIAKLGANPKELMKAISPSGTDITRGLAAGTALQMAEEGNFGPVGTIAAAVIGDLVGHAPKGALNVIKNPKKSLAQATNLVMGANSKKEWISQIIDDANKAGIQLDAGTLTNSNMVRMAQARAAQSALSGTALENFRKDLSQQIVGKYSSIVDELGTLAFENNHQASEAVRNFVKSEDKNLFQQFPQQAQREGRPLVGRVATEQQPEYQQQLLNRISPQEFESSYQAGENLKTAAADIKNPIKEEFNDRWTNFNRQVEVMPVSPQPDLARSLDTFVREHEGSLLLGESSAENRVLQAAARLRDSLMTADGSFIGVTLNDLIKTKRTLGDVANWEFGGSNFESAYKLLVGDIDHSIERTLGRVNPELRAEYEQLKADYSAFKDLFENKNVMPLFEPKNENYNSIYNGFIANPDKLRSLEDIMWNNPRGQELINQIKRDYAQRIIENPNVTARELRNLNNVLGPQYQGAIQEFALARQNALENPLPRVARQPTLGARVQIQGATPGKPIRKGAESAQHARQKLYEYIQGKSSDQIMKMMDTIEGIHKLKRVLSLTEDGKELFNKLSRYKLFEMIDKNMMDNLQENIKLGTFSSLFKSSKSQAVVKELVGPESFKQIQRLQRISGRLQASADKFYNASKSGTTVTDVAAISSLMTGILTGNLFLALSSASAIGGINIAGRLLTNPEFLKYLEEAVLTDNKKKFMDVLNKMKPSVHDAMVKASLEAREEK